MKRFILTLVGGMLVAVAITALAVWRPWETPPPAPKAPSALLKLTILETMASANMEDVPAFSTSTGGTPKHGEKHKSECKFQVDHSQGGGAKTFLLRGESTHITDDKNLPEEERRSFKLTADSEATISVMVRVECRAAIKIWLDGDEVAAPFELTSGKHRLTITGRFNPGP